MSILREKSYSPRAFTKPRLWLTFLRYIGIGGVVFVFNVGVFQLFLNLRFPLSLATTIAYGLSVIVHFLLNKFLNFKSFERSILHQLRTYLAVVTFCWLITVLVVQIGVNWLSLPPVVATMVAIVINIPLGFLGNRYLTFEGGIRAAWRRARRHR